MTPPRYFTLPEANALLPWLEQQFAQLAPVRDELVARQDELLALLRSLRSNGHANHDAEIAESQKQAQRLTEELQRGLQAITERGILVRDVGMGLVDFPALRQGREVHLCWRRGEPSIGFWHETNVGFSGRKPL